MGAHAAPGRLCSTARLLRFTAERESGAARTEQRMRVPSRDGCALPCEVPVPRAVCPRGVPGRQMRGLNPSNAFCRGDRPRRPWGGVHNSRQPDPGCWRLFPGPGLSLGTPPASVPCPFPAPPLHNLHKAGLDPGADLLPAASRVPRCARTPGLARTPVHAHAPTTLLFSLLGLGGSRRDSGIALLSAARFFVTLGPKSLPSGTRGTCAGCRRHSGSGLLGPESLT